MTVHLLDIVSFSNVCNLKWNELYEKVDKEAQAEYHTFVGKKVWSLTRFFVSPI